MVVSAIMRRLRVERQTNIVTRTRHELDLTEQQAVRNFFEQERPDQLYLAATRVGGILANNNYPAEIIYQNLLIEANVIDAAWRIGVKQLFFPGSSCLYPKKVRQPMVESEPLSGKLEPTNEPCTIAKIADIRLCESDKHQFYTDFRSVTPTNFNSPDDNFNLESSHVIPALLRKFHLAKVDKEPCVEVWGSCTPHHEFLHVDDMADACVFVMGVPRDTCQSHTQPMCSHINVGTGNRTRHLHCRAVRTCGRNDRIPGQDPIRQQQARWNTTKLMDVSNVSDRLADPCRFERGPATNLAEVPGTPTGVEKMKRALITGTTGQDGAHLAEFLLDKGYNFHGIERHISLFNTDQIGHLYHDPRYFRPYEVETLLGDATKVREKLGWQPSTPFRDLVADMVREDLLKSHGYATLDCHE